MIILKKGSKRINNKKIKKEKKIKYNINKKEVKNK